MRFSLKLLVVGFLVITLAGCAARRRQTTQTPVFVPPPQPAGCCPPGGPGGQFGATTPGAFPTAPNPSFPAAPSPQGFPTAPQGPSPGFGASPPAGFSQPGFATPPPGGFPTAPPGGYPTAPPAAPPTSPPGGAPPGGFPTAPPATNPAFPGVPPSPPSTSGVIPGTSPDRVGYRWQPDPLVAPAPSPNGNTRPKAPSPNPHDATYPPSDERPNVLLLPPQPENSPEPPRADTPKVQPKLYPPQDDTGPAFPVGIPGFDRPRDGVATGQRPTLEGLDWLKKNGYDVVVFLHLPGERIDTDRQQVEKRNLTFMPLEVDPRKLNRDTVDAFLRLQRSPTNGKVFIYDLDGSLAGGLWYLAFRVSDQDADDIARIKARSLGLREERESHREMWQAVRQYLESR